MHRFEKLNNLSIKIFELNFYQDENKSKQNLILIETCKNGSIRVIDLKIYQNQYCPNKKINAFLGNYKKNFICSLCLISYTSENILMIHKSKCKDNVITTLRTSNESHLHRKNHFHKNP